MKKIITIGREYGSGGRFVAQKVAEKLNIKCYDSELLLKIAEEHNLDQGVVKQFDEKGSLMSNLYCTFVNETSLQARIIEAQFSTIRDLAEKEDCVIVGRCADYVLRNSDTVLSVFIMSTLSEEIKRAVQFYGIGEDKAEDVIKKANKRRASYYNFYTDKKWGRAGSYNLCIDSSIGIEQTADVIVEYASRFFKI